MNIFLTADWVNLIIVSWRVAPAVLEPYLPPGTTLDEYHGDVFISCVAFEFRQTRVRGLTVPLHVNFPEINLRFYAKASGKRGVVFLRELVPSPAIVLVARWLYHEPYASCPMRATSDLSGPCISVRHAFRYKGTPYRVEAVGQNAPFVPSVESLEHFLKEHERGYGTSRRGTMLTYRVEHPRWSVYPIQEYRCDVKFGRVYGDQWAFLEDQRPANVMLAQGSGVSVFEPVEGERPVEAK